MPGSLFNLFISKPESSAIHILPVLFEKYLAFIIEFFLNVFPFSFGLLILKPLGEKTLMFAIYGSDNQRSYLTVKLK